MATPVVPSVSSVGGAVGGAATSSLGILAQGLVFLATAVPSASNTAVNYLLIGDAWLQTTIKLVFVFGFVILSYVLSAFIPELSTFFLAIFNWTNPWWTWDITQLLHVKKSGFKMPPFIPGTPNTKPATAAWLYDPNSKTKINIPAVLGLVASLGFAISIGLKFIPGADAMFGPYLKSMTGTSVGVGAGLAGAGGLGFLAVTALQGTSLASKIPGFGGGGKSTDVSGAVPAPAPAPSTTPAPTPSTTPSSSTTTQPSTTSSTTPMPPQQGGGKAGDGEDLSSTFLSILGVLAAGGIASAVFRGPRPSSEPSRTPPKRRGLQI